MADDFAAKRQAQVKATKSESVQIEDAEGNVFAEIVDLVKPEDISFSEESKKQKAADRGHATALYKDQWRDRDIADYDETHGKKERAKEMRADAGEDRKRIWGMDKKWKHAKYSSGEKKGKKNYVDKEDRGVKEEKDWIGKAIKKPGALRAELGVPEGEKIPADKLNAAAKKGGKLGQRARFAKTLRKMRTEAAAWTKSAGKNKEGGLNEKGRKSYERANPGSDLKRPQPEGGSRRDSFCARMGGMKKKLTSAKTANDPDSRINKALRKWNC